MGGHIQYRCFGVAGTPLHVLQELGGWESAEMVRRYAHLSSEHLAGYVGKFSGLQLVSGYDLATVPQIAKSRYDRNPTIIWLFGFQCGKQMA